MPGFPRKSGPHLKRGICMNVLKMAPALYTELNHLGLNDDFFYSQADPENIQHVHNC